MRHLVEFSAVINSDNDAFVDNEAAEVARILREMADDIAGSSVYCEGNLTDVNGNKCGVFLFEVNQEVTI